MRRSVLPPARGSVAAAIAKGRGATWDRNSRCGAPIMTEATCCIDTVYYEDQDDDDDADYHHGFGHMSVLFIHRTIECIGASAELLRAFPPSQNTYTYFNSEIYRENICPR